MDEDEPYPPDFDDVTTNHRYRFERNSTLHPMYTNSGKVAHIVDSILEEAHCGVTTAIFGTGSWHEQVQAHRLPLCKRCAWNLPYLKRQRDPMETL